MTLPLKLDLSLFLAVTPPLINPWWKRSNAEQRQSKQRAGGFYKARSKSTAKHGERSLFWKLYRPNDSSAQSILEIDNVADRSLDGSVLFIDINSESSA